jgi:proteasome lid subunit RPN8/RPN11
MTIPDAPKVIWTSDTLAKMCAHAIQLFDDHSAEAWGLLFGAYNRGWCYVSDVYQMKYDEDYFVEPVDVINVLYNVSKIPELIDSLEQECKKVIGIYHSHPQTNFTETLFHILPSMYDNNIFHEYARDIHPIITVMSSKNCPKDFKKKFLSFKIQDKTFISSHICYIHNWYKDKPYICRNAISDVEWNHLNTLVLGKFSFSEDIICLRYIGENWEAFRVPL